MVHAAPSSVLVVEDEVLIRALAVDVLEEAGFHVIAAEHADQAVKILEARSPEVRVVFSDVHMPGRMDGVDLAMHVRTCWPWIGVMLTSGKPVPRLAGITPNICFLSKPYILDEVICRVREIAASI
jgi:two-component system, response regulator PdtaR